MKKLFSVIIIALLSTLAVSANGVDDQGNPNDPAVNDRANACYDEGSMADVPCETEWEWTCGWHLIRWEADNSYMMPTTCEILLPPPPAIEEVIVDIVETVNPCLVPDFTFTIDAEQDFDPVLTIAGAPFTDLCNNPITQSINIVTNVYQDSGNSNVYYCQNGGSPYEVQITWTGIEGSWTETYNGNCLVSVPV